MGCAPSSSTPPICCTIVDKPGVQGPTVPTSTPIRMSADFLETSSFHREYALTKRIGQGAFSCVYAGQQKSGQGANVAVKIIALKNTDNNDRERRQIEQEVEILNLVSGEENVVGYNSFFLEGHLAYVVVEKCDLKLLQALERLPQVTERIVGKLLHGMLKGLRAVHFAGVVHRDVKCDNFLVSSGEVFTVKLCDFGFAEYIKPGQKLSQIYGTPPYMAPEMLNANGQRGYGFKVDVWSLGVIAYVLFFGRFPYQPAVRSGKAMKAAIVCGLPAPDFKADGFESTVSVQARAFARSALLRDPWDRPCSDELSCCSLFKALGTDKRHGDSTDLRRSLLKAVRSGAFDLPRATQRPEWTAMDAEVFRMQKLSGAEDLPEVPDEVSLNKPDCASSDASTGVGSLASSKGSTESLRVV